MLNMGGQEAEMATETITTQDEDYTVTIHPALAEAALSVGAADVNTGKSSWLFSVI